MLGNYILALATWVVTLGQCTLAVDVDWTTITNERGDHLPDFSFCGYHSSDKDLPSASRPSSATLQASSADQTAQIQAALDKVAASGGGVVELGTGTFRLSPGLTISNGTTLRGSGVGSTQLSVSKLNGSVPLIALGKDPGHHVQPLSTNRITDSYVGVGASTVTVEDTKGLAAGQAVYVSRTATAQWIRDNGMADLTRDKKPQTWIKEGILMQQPRVIKEIAGNKVTLTVPLTDALDKNYMSPYLATYANPSGDNVEIGLENLSIKLSPTCSGVALDSANGCNAAAISIAPRTSDSYVRQVNVTGFNAFMAVQSNASRITIDGVGLFRDRDTDKSAGYPADIAIQGSQVLVRGSGQYGLRTAKAFSVVTQAGTPGPNAVLRHAVRDPELQQIYPHQRWAHGLLAEDTDAGVLFVDRGNAGTGHGWAVSAGVAWNVRGGVNISSPPLGVNWGVGITGAWAKEGNGSMVDEGAAVTPTSLFDAQLARRKGTHVLHSKAKS
ncbi:hypothetical protein GGR54DRAFT_634451 [Hypoxylon sp. NC1633]|nr:hypothetical protein GGR54DRAFT_634451 [Hypoxylon sp. NC1633]